MNSNILLVVPSLSKLELPPLFTAMQVGCAGSKEHFAGMLHDDDGINISKDNPYYCELTAQYWVWKNTDSNFVGFMHHRRFFMLTKENIRDTLNPNFRLRPYYIYDRPDLKTLDRIGLNTASISSVASSYDIVAPAAEKIYETVRHQYNRCEKPVVDEMKMICDIINEYYPEYRSAAESYLDGREAYFCNMFMMRRDVFDEYCTWLFDILKRMDEKRIANQRRLRDNGKIGERLFGIYFMKKTQDKVLRLAQTPRAHFSDIEGATKNKSFSRLLYAVAPPGSFRRAILRRL